MNPVGYSRLRKWEAGGKQPLAPLTECMRNVIADGYCLGGHIDSVTILELRALDRDLEIVFDRCTTDGSGRFPGFHLYRRIKGLPDVGDRMLRLEFSLQYDCDMKWPEGRPRMPGRWVVEEFKKRRLAGNTAEEREAALKRQIAERSAEYDAEDRKAEKELDYEVGLCEKDCEKMAGKIIDGRAIKGARRRLRPKDAPIQVAIASKVEG